MQNSVLNLVDLFSAAEGIDDDVKYLPIVVALEHLRNTPEAISDLADMMEHMPMMTNHQMATLLFNFALSLPDNGVIGPVDVIEEGSLQTLTKKTASKPSWDTFAKARPITIKSNVGVFM